MHQTHLLNLDLNLLKSLDALLVERSVTRAAARIGLTQPAMSHSLSRLRAAFADPLFVRVPGGIEPTPRAEALAKPLARALAELAEAVAPPPLFDPAQSRRRFTIATDDYLELILLPPLMARLWQLAPGIDVVIVPVSDRSGADLVKGAIDAIISVSGVLGGLQGAMTLTLFEERFVCVLRRDHPNAHVGLDLETFAGLPHVQIAPTGRSGGPLDRELDRLGKRRRVALQVPHFLAAPRIIRETDAVLTLGERLARALDNGLVLQPVPVELPRFAVALYWHRRRHDDPAHRWLRSVTAEVARTI